MRRNVFSILICIVGIGAMSIFTACGGGGGGGGGAAEPTGPNVSISTGPQGPHGYIVEEAGTLLAWGRNHNEDLGFNTFQDSVTTPTQVGTDTDWKSIVDGNDHGLGIKDDGSLYAWGRNTYGEMGTATTVLSAPARIGTDTNWDSLSAYNYVTMGLKGDGTIWMWGKNDYGHLGSGILASSTPMMIGTETDWNQIAVGYFAAFALKNDGTLWAWGSDTYSLLGQGVAMPVTHEPIMVGSDTDWDQVSAGYNYVLGLKSDGTLWGWGYNRQSQLGMIGSNFYSVPTQIGSDSDWSKVSAGYQHALAVKSDNTIWGWGVNSYSQAGTSATGNVSVPTMIGTGTDWWDVAAKNDHSIGLKADGTVWAWGRNNEGQLANGEDASFNAAPERVGTWTTWDQVESGEDFSLAVATDGSLWSWGFNNGYNLGQGEVIASGSSGNALQIPARVGTATNWSQAAGGRSFAIGKRDDGSLWGWGASYDGATGVCSPGPGGVWGNSSPARIGTGNSWGSISAGSLHTVALKTDKSLWAWGRNDYAMIGTDPGVDPMPKNCVPSRIGTDTDWDEISAHGWHNLAIKSNRTLWAWGRNNYGQAGTDNTLDPVVTPSRIGTGSNWLHVAAGDYHSLAVREDGSLWAWGYNYNSAIGTTGIGSLSYPARIGTATDWADVGAGDYFSFGIKEDGSLLAWGSNNNGQLGTSGWPAHVPNLVSQATSFAQANGGWYHTLTLDRDGNMWSMGDNSYGQVGNGRAWQSTPGRVY